MYYNQNKLKHYFYDENNDYEVKGIIESYNITENSNKELYNKISKFIIKRKKYFMQGRLVYVDKIDKEIQLMINESQRKTV